MNEINVSEYTRDDLETFVKSLPNKSEYLIVGTEAELKEKHLSYKTQIHGVSCAVKEKGKIVDKKKKPVKRVDRGKIHKHSLSEKPDLDINNSEEV